jgi:hypothetical protein
MQGFHKTGQIEGFFERLITLADHSHILALEESRVANGAV